MACMENSEPQNDSSKILDFLKTHDSNNKNSYKSSQD